MEIGQIGEKLARTFLEEKGYQFIEANYSIPAGELDLIMSEGDVTVFIEVKTRNEVNNVSAPLDIPQSKIDRIQIASEHYAAENQIEDWRVEIVGISLLKNGLTQVSHLPLGG